MAGDVLISGEVVGACVLIVIAVLLGMVLRRRAIASGQSVTLVALARKEGWKLGIARFTASSVQWFPLFGVRLRPRFEWRRGDLQLEAPSPLKQRARPMAIIDPVEVIARADGTEYRIALAPGDYTALRSWSESAPPGLNANVV